MECVRQNTVDSLEQKLKGLVDGLMWSGYEGEEKLGNYLKSCLRDISVELKNGLENRCLDSILAI